MCVHFHLGRKAVTITTMGDFRRRANDCLNKAMGAVIDAERAKYRAEQALVRCEEAELKASTAYTCSVEAVQILAQEMRELAAGVPIGVESFDKLIEMASEEQRKPFQAYDPRDMRIHAPKPAEAIGVRLPKKGKSE